MAREDGAMRVCERCGHDVPPGRRFCSACGQLVDKSSHWSDGALIALLVLVALPCFAIGTCAVVTGPLSADPRHDHAYDFFNNGVALFTFAFSFGIAWIAYRKRQARKDGNEQREKSSASGANVGEAIFKIGDRREDD